MIGRPLKSQQKRHVTRKKVESGQYTKTVAHNFREDPDVTKAREDQMLTKQTKNLIKLMNHEDFEEHEDDSAADEDSDEDTDEDTDDDADEDIADEDTNKNGNEATTQELEDQVRKLSTGLREKLDKATQGVDNANALLRKLENDSDGSDELDLSDASSKGKEEADMILNKAKEGTEKLDGNDGSLEGAGENISEDADEEDTDEDISEDTGDDDLEGTDEDVSEDTAEDAAEDRA